MTTTPSPSFEEIAKAFVTHYYTLFDGSSEDRAKLGGLYVNLSIIY
jgi:hypothetical protein